MSAQVPPKVKRPERVAHDVVAKRFRRRNKRVIVARWDDDRSRSDTDAVTDDR